MTTQTWRWYQSVKATMEAEATTSPVSELRLVCPFTAAPMDVCLWLMEEKKKIKMQIRKKFVGSYNRYTQKI